MDAEDLVIGNYYWLDGEELVRLVATRVFHQAWRGEADRTVAIVEAVVSTHLWVKPEWLEEV